jgi:histidine triad (HIT) family protein
LTLLRLAAGAGKLPLVEAGRGDCIFCAIASGDANAEILDSDERTVAFMDINPATRGHALVIPRAHSENLFDVDPEDLEATIFAARRLAERMRETLKPDGFNLLNSTGRAAWQSVFHFHIHVIPRYVDDPLQLPWRPAPADPDELAAVAAALRGGR